METIEPAVERIRRPLKADGTARPAPLPEALARTANPVQDAPSAPGPHAFKAQLAEAQLPIKTRVLCEYSPDVQPIVTGKTPLSPERVRLSQTIHMPHAILASVIAGMVGAVGMAGAMWYSGHSGDASQAPGWMTKSVPVAAVAAPATATTLAVPAVAAPDPAPARELVDAWAKAWSARDVDRYIGFYATGFIPDKGADRSTWESGRRKRLAAQKVIQVAVRDVQVEMQGADRATVRFVQDYSADTYREMATPKKLLLVREAGGWRIVAEAAG
jgi:hypothetical protein